MIHPMGRHLWILPLVSLVLGSCADEHTGSEPVRSTPAGAMVDLSMISLRVEDAEIIRHGDGTHELRFKYTVENQAGAIIAFPCLYSNTDELIEVNLEDKDKQPLALGKRPLEGLTLTEPRPMRIPMGQSTRSYEVPVLAPALLKADPVGMRVRMHAPSRYDELRTSIEAHRITLLWP